MCELPTNYLNSFDTPEKKKIEMKFISKNLNKPTQLFI